MYKYMIEMHLKLPNGNSRSPRKEFIYEKKHSIGDINSKKEILRAAAAAWGEDPSCIDWNHSNTTIDFRGELKEKKQSDSNDSEKPKKSFWTPAWAIPFKIIWFLIRRILFFWI